MFSCSATRYSRMRPARAPASVIERCPRHIRGVAVRKVLTCAHALEVAVHDPFSRLFSIRGSISQSITPEPRRNHPSDSSSSVPIYSIEHGHAGDPARVPRCGQRLAITAGQPGTPCPGTHVPTSALPHLACDMLALTSASRDRSRCRARPCGRRRGWAQPLRDQATMAPAPSPRLPQRAAR